jgi:hypothetical protein
MRMKKERRNEIHKSERKKNDYLIWRKGEKEERKS